MKVNTLINILILFSIFLLTISSFSTEGWYDTFIFDNLQWSLDGNLLIWESEFISDIAYRDPSPKILSYNISTNKISNLTPDTQDYITTSDNNKIILESLYGYNLLTIDEGVEEILFSPINYFSYVNLLDINDNYSKSLYALYDNSSGSCHIIKKDNHSDYTEQVMEVESVVSFLKNSDSILYILEENDMDESNSSNNDKLYIKDLNTSEERFLFELDYYDEVLITPDEKTALITTWHEYLSEYSKLFMFNLVQDNPEKILLFSEEDAHFDYHSINLAEDGSKLLFHWWKWTYNYDKDPPGSSKLYTSIIDLSNNEICTSNDIEGGNHNWSPDNTNLVFNTIEYINFDTSVFYVNYINIFDTDKKEIIMKYRVEEIEEDNAIYSNEDFSLPDYDDRFISNYYVKDLLWSKDGDFLICSMKKDIKDEELLRMILLLNLKNDEILSIDNTGGSDNISWLNNNELIYTFAQCLFKCNLITGEEELLSTGNGRIFSFDEDNNLVYRVEGLPKVYPEYWVRDMVNGDIKPYKLSKLYEEWGSVLEEANDKLENYPFLSNKPDKPREYPSPDGTKLVILEFNKLTLQDVDGSNPIVLMENDAYSPVWSPSGENIAWIESPWGYGSKIWMADNNGNDIEIVVNTLDNYRIRINEN